MMIQENRRIQLNSGLRNEIVSQHNDRMNYLKKYLPFFRLQETAFTQYKEGRYSKIDLGYITMALLRFFIEENHFNDKSLTSSEIYNFLKIIVIQDFELILSLKEEKELIDYIFDKIKNDGKPFTMDYFDPMDKKVKTARMRLIDSRLVETVVFYTITADAIEFYLETKEIKDESRISVQQLLLEKMISSKNFRGGIEVVRRINSEVVKLRLRKKEVIALLGLNVFEGVKALKDFQRTGMQWFEEEQKAFVKNKELIQQALVKAENMAESRDTLSDYTSMLKEIHELESELRKAMSHHTLLLSDCTDLQVRADEMIYKYKISRLRNAFDFKLFMDKIKEHNDLSKLHSMLGALFQPQIRKSFYLGNIDDLLTLPITSEFVGEEVKDLEEEAYIFEDELEEERIAQNYFAMIKVLLQMLRSRPSFTLVELNQELELTFFDDIFINSDYYSFLVHLCQKKEYHLQSMMKHQDTFLDAVFVRFLEEKENQKYLDLKFTIEFPSEMEAGNGKKMDCEQIVHAVSLLQGEREFITSNICFTRCK